MFNLNSKIIVSETRNLVPVKKVFEINFVKDIKIESGYKNLTDTATIILPKKVVTNWLSNKLGFDVNVGLPLASQERSIHEYLKQDSYIEVFLGYDGDLKPAFRGYITSVKGDAPVEVKCEDFMYVLKKYKMIECGEAPIQDDLLNEIPNNPSVAMSSFDVEKTICDRLNALKEKLPIKISVSAEHLGTQIVDREITIAKFLEKLKDKGIYSFFKIEENESILCVTNNPTNFSADDVNNMISKYGQLDGSSIIKGLLKGVISNLGIGNIVNLFKSNAFLGEGRFRFFHNIISDNLKVNAEEVKEVKVRVKKHFANTNTPVFVEVGEEQGKKEEGNNGKEETKGETVVFEFHDNETMLPTDPELYKKEVEKIKAELNAFGALRLGMLKQTGVSGTFTTFGEPFMRPTDRVTLENAEDKEKNGVFQICSVNRSFGVDGYRQTIELERKISKA